MDIVRTNDVADAAFLNESWRQIKQATITAAQSGLLFGINLTAKKEALDHGEWEGFVRGHCEFSPRTARDYMRTADLCLAAASKRQREAVVRLAGLPLETLDSEASAALEKITGGKSLRALLGPAVVPSPPEGGARKRTPKTPPTPKEKLAAEREDARAKAADLVAELDRYVRMKRHLYLTHTQRRTTATALRDAADTIEEEHDEHDTSDT